MESMSNYEQLDFWTFPAGAILKPENPKVQKSNLNEKSKKNEKEKTEQQNHNLLSRGKG